MNKTERIFKIEQLIATRKVVSFKALLDQLEISRATLKRDLEYLRSRMKAPIVYDRELEGYGIFSGKARAWAKLRFTPQRARWVATEEWHPKQRAHFEDDGAYVLEFPYADDRELVGNILRHSAEVEVLAPAQLRKKIAAAHTAAARRYT